MLDPRDHKPSTIFNELLIAGLSEAKIRRLLGAVLGRGDYDPSSWSSSGILKNKESNLFAKLPTLTLEKSITSPIDGFKKLLFRTSDGLAIESVIIPLKKEKCVTVCLSSQVGCVMNCQFCATARMKDRRNLETWEIIDQFIQTRAVASTDNRKITGVVFMGMGEPFLNYHRVMAAAELLSYPVLNPVSAKAITVSTVGLVDKIDQFTTEKRPFRLSISLGAATDEKRALLVPVAAKTPIKEVMAAAKRYSLTRKKRVMLAYVCIHGVNVGEEDAKALADLVLDTPVRLDLIEVTDSTGRFKKPTDDEMNLFRDALTYYLKQPVVRRYSGGADINAACGTLAGV